MDRGGAEVFLVIVARVEQLLSKNFLSLRLFLLGPLVFWGEFFLCTCQSSKVASSFRFKSGLYGPKRKPRVLIGLSLYLSKSTFVCFIYNVRVFRYM